jgi:hypothetical protein
MVNFRHSGGCMHIALTARMADSARSIKPALLVGGPCSDFDAINQRKSLGDNGRKSC